MQQRPSRQRLSPNAVGAGNLDYAQIGAGFRRMVLTVGQAAQ